METTEVILNESGQGEVLLLSDNKKAGWMQIAIKEGMLEVYHTEVEPLHEGKGFAKILLNQLVTYAREQQLKIVPLCPYVHLQFRRHPDEYKDIWAKK